MAELEAELAPNARWATSQTRAQFRAIAWLRWRIMVNAFRRKGGAGELVARIILYPILASLALLPILGVGPFAFYFAQTGRIDRISLLLWVTFGLCQLLNIQLGQPGSTFDPTQLIRFPLTSSRYTVIRLFFGLLTPANVIGAMMSLAIAVGASLAQPALWPYALVTLAVFALANVLFSRMIFAWVDRWLSTRRAREVFTALIFVFSLGIQYANFTYNPAYNRHSRSHGDPSARINAAMRFYQRAHPFVQVLPPELTARSLVAAGHGQTATFAGFTLGCAAFAAAFLAIFALRMRTEFRGENLSDAANAVAKKPVPKPTASHRREPAQANLTAAVPANTSGPQPSPALSAMLTKELLYLRRNVGLFYGVIAPLVFVMIFAGRLSTRATSTLWVFPAAVAYTLLGIIPLSFNSFGLEGAGAQFYFLAPVRLRDVLLAKNLMNFAVAAAEAVAVYFIVAYAAGAPRIGSTAIALLWAGGTLLISTTLGNRRSFSAPKQINPARASRRQASGLSGLIAMGILLLSAALAAAIPTTNP